MSLSKKQCNEFLENPTINPISRRKIIEGRATHKRLMEECREILKTNPVPPIGPMMHWKMYQNDGKNLIDFANYIETRVVKLQKEKLLSKMEIIELKAILQEISNEYSHKKHIVTFCEDLLVKLTLLKKENTFIDDVPKKTIVRDKRGPIEEVSPDRVKNRLHVYAIWNRMSDVMYFCEKLIKRKKVDITIGPGEVRDIIRGKTYLDYLIAHNIFTYDDIYKNTFKSENDFKELEDKYKIYQKIYKDIKGEMPL